MDRLQLLTKGRRPFPANKQQQILGTEQQVKDHHRRESQRLAAMNLKDKIEDEGRIIITPTHQDSIE